MEKKALKIYYDTIVNGSSVQHTWPSGRAQAVITGNYTYSASRMGAAPTLTADLFYPICLDNLWRVSVESSNIKLRPYVMPFGEEEGKEKFYADQTPTSGKSTDNIMYKHSVTFTSERVVLDNTYLYDVVTDNVQEDDRYRSNTSSFCFYGNIVEMVNRLNFSLAYCGLCKYNANTKRFYDGYYLVIDEDTDTTEDKLVTFEDKTVTQGLQEIYSIFKLRYYFDGKVCHVGDHQHEIATPLKYGQDDGLLSITRTNTGESIIDRITGYGSDKNVPFYYPNDNEWGQIDFAISPSNSIYDCSIEDHRELVTKLLPRYPQTFTYTKFEADYHVYDGGTKSYVAMFHPVRVLSDETSMAWQVGSTDSVNFWWDVRVQLSGKVGSQFKIRALCECEMHVINQDGSFNPLLTQTYNMKFSTRCDGNVEEITEFDEVLYRLTADGNASVIIHYYYNYPALGYGRMFVLSERTEVNVRSKDYWTREDETQYDADALGLVFTLPDGAELTINNVTRLPYAGKLMPSIFRATAGKDRFLPATNGIYDPDTSLYEYNAEEGAFVKKDPSIEFINQYELGNQHEYIKEFDDIYPTIKGSGFDRILDVAFDVDDNNVKADGTPQNTPFGGTDEYIHSYFYIKLGQFDFNLFECGLPGTTAMIEMTSGACAGCKFEIGVVYNENDKEHKRGINPVQAVIDGNSKIGNIVAGSYNQKVDSNNIQPEQQDTRNGGVWIAVKKDNTFITNQVFPDSRADIVPQAGDTFVITGIKMPTEYVERAEQQLDTALLDYMAEHNTESFDYQISISRIYIQQHPDLFNELNENTLLNIEYNDVVYKLYVSNFTINADENLLCDIKVELTAETSPTESGLQRKVTSIAEEALSSGNAISKILDRLHNRINTSGGVDKASYATEAGHAQTANEAQHAAEADHTQTADDADKWDGAHRSEYLNQPVRTTDDVAFNSVFTDLLQSLGFEEGALGHGFKMSYADGRAKMEVDELLVRRIATFLKLEIRELSYVGGTIVLSQAGSEITKVSERAQNDGWVCYFKADDGKTSTMNFWKVGDKAKCQTFNIKEGVHENVSNRYYWRKVIEVGNDYVVLSATDHDKDTDNSKPNSIPAAGDKIVQFGYYLSSNASESDPGDEANQSRTTLLMLSTNGGNAPCIEAYANIGTPVPAGTEWSMEGKRIFLISPNGVEFKSSYFKWTSGGEEYPQVIYKGDWHGEEHEYYDEVTHNGSTWLCVAPEGIHGDDTSVPPSDGNPNWQKRVSKGEQGNPGAAAKVYQIQPQHTFIVKRADGTVSASSSQCQVTVTEGGTTEVLQSLPIEFSVFSIVATANGATTGTKAYSNGQSDTVAVTSATTSVEWQLKKRDEVITRVTVPVIADGQNGTSVKAEYSVSGTGGWHTTFSAGDIYMRTFNGTAWSSAIRIVGENGENGDYTDYAFAISANTTAPTDTTAASWSDAPVATTDEKPYLWMRTIRHTFNNGVETTGTPAYIRLTGEKGEKGEQGEKGQQGNNGAEGKSAFEVIVPPVVFNTNENGSVNPTSKTVSLSARYKGTATNVSVTVQSIVTYTGCSASKSGRTVTISNVSTKHYKDDGTEDTSTNAASTAAYHVPVTSGYAVASVTLSYNGYSETREVNVPFSVNIDAHFGKFYHDNRVFESTIGAVQSGINGLNASVSEIKQTADNIQLSVGALGIGNKNLIPDSFVRLTFSAHYPDMRRTVYLRAGQTYTLSANGRCRNGEVQYAQVIVHRNWSPAYNVDVTSNDDATFSATFTASQDGAYSVCVVGKHRTNGDNTNTAYWQLINWMKLEEGDKATPWLPCEDDTVVKPNLLTSPTKGAGVTAVSTILPDGKQGTALFCSNTSSQKEMVKQGNVYVERGMTYTLSFWGKGSGRVESYLDPNACEWRVKQNEANIYYGGAVVYKSASIDGATSNTLTADWKQYIVTFTADGDGVTTGNKTCYAVRLAANTGYAYICGWKLEEGGRVTSYDDDPLARSGIDIRKGEIHISSNGQLTIDTKNFKLDREGNAEFSGDITAAKINALLRSRPLEITNYNKAAYSSVFSGVSCLDAYKLSPMVIMSTSGTIVLPSFSHWRHSQKGYADYDDWLNDEAQDARSMIGQTITIYNNTGVQEAVKLKGFIKWAGGSDGTITVGADQCVSLLCKLGFGTGTDQVYWYYDTTNNFKTGNN